MGFKKWSKMPKNRFVPKREKKMGTKIARKMAKKWSKIGKKGRFLGYFGRKWGIFHTFGKFCTHFAFFGTCLLTELNSTYLINNVIF